MWHGVGRPRRAARDRAARLAGDPAREHQRRGRCHAVDDHRGARRPAVDLHVIKFLADNEFRTFWAWLGLILAIVIVVGAWMNMQAAGEGLADVRDQVSLRRPPAKRGWRPRRQPTAQRRRHRAATAVDAGGGRASPPTKPQAPRTPPNDPPDAASPGASSLTGRGARLHSAHGRDRHAAGQDGPRRDAQGRRHHGRRRRRAGADRRGRGRVRGDGARARPGRHPPRRRRRAHVRSAR